MKQFQQSLPRAKRLNPLAFVMELLHLKKLTHYQVKRVLSGITKDLLIGDYVLIDELGQGGSGKVFKAKHQPTGRIVALKRLAYRPQGKMQSKQFAREAETMLRLKHSNMVAAFEFEEINGDRYLCMEYIKGIDLQQQVSQRGALSVEKAVHCILQAAQGLDYAHQQGVIHRDIKPANLIATRQGEVKVLDLGLARLPDSGNLTVTGQMFGTLHYMPPEQSMDAKRVDHRADIYSLGCVLYFLLTGKPMYAGNLSNVTLAHRCGDTPSLTDANAQVPSWLDKIFQKMVAKNPGDRYQSMAEVISAFKTKPGANSSPTLVNRPAISTLTNTYDGGFP